MNQNKITSSDEVKSVISSYKVAIFENSLVNLKSKKDI
jgi:hypothetical protein